jgi:hypothetical protein
MGIERDLQRGRSSDDRTDLLHRVDQITEAVNSLTAPASFADQVYVLRDHAAAVRRRIHEERPAALAVSS